VGLLICTDVLFSLQSSYVVGLLICTVRLFSGQGSYVVGFFSVPMVCLVDRAAMLWVCYCVSLV
jgi:hypothetical protein